MLMELERECMEVYRRKVTEAVNTKSRLHQSVMAKEAELAALMAALGELGYHSQVENYHFGPSYHIDYLSTLLACSVASYFRNTKVIFTSFPPISFYHLPIFFHVRCKYAVGISNCANCVLS